MTDIVSTDERFSKFAQPATEAPNYESMKEIRLNVPLSDERHTKDLELGDYYIVDFNVSEGENAKVTKIGKSFEGVILRDAMKTRKWDSEENRNTYDSSEFRSFRDPVILYDHTVSPARIRAALPYTHDNEDAPCIGGSGEHALKQSLGLRIKYLMYILYEGEIYRMNFTATDNAGAGEGDAPLGFRDYAENSFMGYKAICNEIAQGSIFLFKCKFSAHVHSKKLILKTFEMTGGITAEKEKTDVLDKLEQLYKDLSSQMWGKFARCYENTDISKLDPYSQKMLEMIESQGTEYMLYASEKAQKLPEPAVKDAEVVDIAEAAKDVFPPSEEQIEEYGKKVAELSDTAKVNKAVKNA